MSEELTTPGLGSGDTSSDESGPLESATPESTPQTASSESKPAVEGQPTGAAATDGAESVESLRERISQLERVADASNDVIKARTDAFDRVMSENQRIQMDLSAAIADDEAYLDSIQENPDAWTQIVSDPKLYRQWQQRTVSLDRKKESLLTLQQREGEFSKEAFGILDGFRNKLGMDQKQWDEFLSTNGQVRDPLTGQIVRNAFANLSPHQALRVGMDQLRGRYLEPLMGQARTQAKREAEARVMRTTARALPTGGGGTPLPQGQQSEEETALLADLERQIAAGEI